MKQFSITFFLAIIFAASIGTVFGQANFLINTWKIDERSIPVFSEVIIERVSKTNPEQAKQLEAYPDAVADLVKGLEYTFAENGVYEVNSAQGKQAGTWKRAGNDLITQVSGGAERKDSIISISKNKLVLLNRRSQKTC